LEPIVYRMARSQFMVPAAREVARQEESKSPAAPEHSTIHPLPLLPADERIICRVENSGSEKITRYFMGVERHRRRFISTIGYEGQILRALQQSKIYNHVSVLRLAVPLWDHRSGRV